VHHTHSNCNCHCQCQLAVVQQRQQHRIGWRGGGIRRWRVAAVDSKGGGRGGDGGSSRYSSLFFFSNHCGTSFCLGSVELYSRNSNKGNIAIFPLSQGIYPAIGGIHSKQRKISNEVETVVEALPVQFTTSKKFRATHPVVYRLQKRYIFFQATNLLIAEFP
jgi:hypothetical protein